MIPAITTSGMRTLQIADLPALAEFLQRIYRFAQPGQPPDTQFLEWKYLRPSTHETNRSYVLERDGRIVAHCGVCPVILRLPGGSRVKTVTMMDWAADPSIPGIGVRLFRAVMEMAPASFIVGGATATRQIIPRIGFRLVGESLTYSAWIRPWREFRARTHATGSALRPVLRLFHGITHPSRHHFDASAWNFTQVDTFDDTVLPVLNSTKQGWTICERTIADLNYLLQCPRIKTQGFLLKRQKQVIGYFILGRAGWEARLLDLAVDSAEIDDWNMAYAAATEAARLDPEVCRIRAQSTFPLIGSALRRNGYWRQYSEPIMLFDPAKALDGAFPAAFQLLDGDSGY